MSDNTMPERLWVFVEEDAFDDSTYYTGLPNADYQDTEYIRADVAAVQLDAERKRIANAVDAIVGMNPSFDMHLYAQAIKAAVWNSDDDPQEILKRELRRMPK